MNRQKKLIIVFAVLFAVLLTAQILIQNRLLISCGLSGCEEKNFELGELLLSNGKNNDSHLAMASDSSLTLNFDAPAEVRAVHLEHSDITQYSKKERVFLAEILYELEKVPGRLFSAGKVNCYNQEDIDFSLRAGGNVTRIVVKLEACSSYYISSVSVNGGMGVRFSFSKFALWALVLALVFAVLFFDLHKKVFRPESTAQKFLFVLIGCFLVMMSCIVCDVSIEKEYTVEYPLTGSVDDHGCYIQVFDAFQKGQCNIDTDFDLSLLEGMNNPYDFYERKEVIGEPYGPVWDRAYYDGKLFSYFGVAPVIYLYYPFYFITGSLPSDALAAAFIAAGCCVMMLLLLWELCRKYTTRLPVWLMAFAGVAIPFGSLVFVTQTCANFYHIAVMSGIFSVCGFLYAGFRAVRTRDGVCRKLFFALTGVFVAATVASRPPLVLYALVLIPIFLEVLKKRPFGNASTVKDVAAFFVPMLMLGGLIMAYNHARFGSVFDFGNDYQLTLTDTSTYNASLSMVIPAVVHYYFQFPALNGVFPYLHPSVSDLEIYGSWTYLYNTIGTAFIPATWGNVALFYRSRKDGVKRATLVLAMAAAFAVAFVDMCFGGVHLRYAADIMFVMMIFGTFLLLCWADSAGEAGKRKGFVYFVVFGLLAMSVLVSIPLCLDNERDMILKYHTEFYNWLM